MHGAAATAKSFVPNDGGQRPSGGAAITNGYHVSDGGSRAMRLEAITVYGNRSQIPNPFSLAVIFLIAMIPPWLASAAHAAVDIAKIPAASSRTISFEPDVRPILAASCYSCHGETKQKGGLRLDVKALALQGGDSGPAISAGNGAGSILVQYVAGLDPDNVMPKKGDRLTAEQVGILRAWIDQGARWPETAGVAAVKDKADHWAFKPMVEPPLPEVHDPGWVRNPIDQFVLAKLDEKGLAPAPPADRPTLLRRAYFDLTGLPPTPEDVAAFVADGSPDAYEKVVDRLLASPHYGERWARHWMDVAHFAETHGNDQDRERPHAWPYRDYLIRAFNDDMPYARFIEEQIAGDVLYPNDPQATVATGFIAAGPWDESSQLDVRDDTIDKKVAQNLDRDDMVTTTMSTFVSATVHCARCHDHKFDPFTQSEYYGLQAVFAGVDRAERPYDVDAQTHERRMSLTRQKAGLENGKYVDGASPLDASLQADAEAWARTLPKGAPVWTALVPATMQSSDGSTLTVQDDLSIRSTGARPDKDIYTVTAETDVRGVTAVRVELLTDDTLPHHGPGRQDNGNLHINEFSIYAGPKGSPATQPVEIAAAHADFDQDGWTIAMSIDHKPQTAWGIYPQVGKPHFGIYELKQPMDGGAALKFILEQTHGEGHLIGRFRISVTNAPLPLPAQKDALPALLDAILAKPADERTADDRMQLTAHYLKGRIDRDLNNLPAPLLVYAAASDFTPKQNFKPAKTPRPVFVLQRGDVGKPLAPAVPGALECVPGLPARFTLADPEDEGSRRAALAKWISNPKNCLTWRSIVNRVWHYHFGHGIVATPNDFGHMGAAPTHPELLDWLALWFLDHGGSIKQLHRLILTSNTYRQSVHNNADFAKIDSTNQFLWRMNRSRLDAECVRDSILQVTGLADTKMGGPSVKQFVEKPGIHVTKVADYDAFDVDSADARRLSIYRFIFRTVPDPFMDAMDCPDASQLAPVRNTSVTALQAMAMWNDRFVVRYSEHLAERATRGAPDLDGQIRLVYRLCLGRDPTASEMEALSEYARKYGMSNLCRVVLNSNEFLFVN
jgi:mono/diheme cytochrome c family protein